MAGRTSKVIKVRVEVSNGAGSDVVIVCAESLRQAERVAKARHPDTGAVRIIFPIEPDDFFADIPYRVADAFGAPEEH